jgi:diguanylate cyclase (GGDEF)-like protein
MPPPPAGGAIMPEAGAADGLEALLPAMRVGQLDAASARAGTLEARSRRSLVRWLGDGIGSLPGRLRDAGEVLWSSRGARLVHEFADVIEAARDPEPVETTLVRLAGVLADAYLVELMLDRDVTTQPDPKRIAVWPEQADPMSADDVVDLSYPLCLGLWCGDHYQMTLQIYARPGHGGRWPRRVVRRLTTLCAMAAAAERGLHAGRRARHEVYIEAEAAIRDATFLSAILPYALTQAHRHREPLTIFCLEIDRLAALAQQHGKPRSDMAVRRLVEAIAGTLRGSDVVARLDDDRIVVVLPNTGTYDARTVASVVQSALVAACQTPAGPPELSFSIGVACFPEDGPETAPLLAAADDAMHRARALGRNQVANASLPPPVALAPVAPAQTQTQADAPRRRA